MYIFVYVYIYTQYYHHIPAFLLVKVTPQTPCLHLRSLGATWDVKVHWRVGSSWRTFLRRGFSWDGNEMGWEFSGNIDSQRGENWFFSFSMFFMYNATSMWCDCWGCDRFLRRLIPVRCFSRQFEKKLLWPVPRRLRFDGEKPGFLLARKVGNREFTIWLFNIAMENHHV